jgi:signal transduction histidine kinase
MTINKSLKTRLLKNLLLLMSVAWLITLVTGYFLGQKTLDKQFDIHMKEIANSLSNQTVTSESTYEYQIFQNEKKIRNSENAPEQTFSNNDGYSQNVIEQKTWRVFSSQIGDSRISVGQDLGLRKNLIQAMIFSGLWPMVIALPIIALIIWLSVSVSLKPLSALTTAIKERSPKQLSQINLKDLPIEVVPVVESLNNLLGVVDQALEREKQFTNNAAHELRTPLAGIKAQVEATMRATDEHEKSEGLKAINQGIDRATRMVNQLLTLARLDPVDLQDSFTKVDLNELVKQVIVNLTPLALAKKIDLGLEKNDLSIIIGDYHSLEIMITNLVDNAIRYTPTSGKIDLFLCNKGSSNILTIEDTGPGISPQDHERVFHRFVRLEGNHNEGIGIGLAMVKRIVDLHKAKIELSAPKDHPGLKVALTFAMAKQNKSV